METKRYLGDSVYAEMQWPGIILTTNNGFGDSNLIVLESSVWFALVEFVRQYTEKQKQLKLERQINLNSENENG